MLKFDIVSFKTVYESSPDRKYISYRLCVTLGHPNVDFNLSYIYRRYTDFFTLYNNLKKDNSALMAGVSFPKKVMMGNFNPELITNRSTGFESLLEHIAKETRLREAPCTISFFQDNELEKAKILIAGKEYHQALVILVNIFTLLNKVYTDRSKVVLVALCRLVACGVGDATDASLARPAERWANLGLHRFDGVCDTDLLSLYVPLIKACIHIRNIEGKSTEQLENTLNDMKRRGMRVDNSLSLMEAIDKLE